MRESGRDRGEGKKKQGRKERRIKEEIEKSDKQ